MARGRKTQNWLAIALTGSVFLNFATPIYYSVQAGRRQEVVVFDTASGTLLLSPIVDPGSTSEVLTQCCLWAAQCLLERSAVGFRHPELLRLMFNSDAAKKANAEWEREAREYKAKNLVSTVDVRRISPQAIGNGLLSAQIDCKVTVTGIVNGEPTRQDRDITVNFRFAKNPDLIRVHRYPLMVIDYSYPQLNQTAQK